MILAIDPGTTESALVLWDGKNVLSAGIFTNDEIIGILKSTTQKTMAIEMVASYGMAVGASVFETVFWIGRFCEAFPGEWVKIYRKDVKMHLCHSMRAKNSNIRQALVDRFGNRPTKARPNPVYGDIKLATHMWSAFAIAVYWHDTKGNQT